MNHNSGFLSMSMLLAFSILAETHVVLGVVKGMGREEEVIKTLPEKYKA